MTGAGYELNGVTGEGIVDDFRPNGGPATAPTSVASGAYEEDAYAGNWSDGVRHLRDGVTTLVRCGRPANSRGGYTVDVSDQEPP
ncbi:hypothetical protein [Micromonospora sp. NPDC005206]|uniref:hypothetical protein n=1 Tax=Micromonospora sp. NPDC005206 TaxID=3157022 RepID=UPI0033B42091